MPVGVDLPRIRFGRPVPSEPQGISMFRDPENPFGRHLVPDLEGICPPVPSHRLRDLLGPGLYRPRDPARPAAPEWNAVALFFNLAEENRPSDYQPTTGQ